MKQISVSSAMILGEEGESGAGPGALCSPTTPRGTAGDGGKHTTSFSTGHYKPSSCMDLRANSTWFLRGLLWVSSPVWVPGAREGLG